MLAINLKDSQAGPNYVVGEDFSTGLLWHYVITDNWSLCRNIQQVLSGPYFCYQWQLVVTVFYAYCIDWVCLVGVYD